MLKFGNIYISFGSWRFKINRVRPDWWQFRIGFIRISYMPGYQTG